MSLATSSPTTSPETSLTEKLANLKNTLSPQEAELFQTIIRSAAAHADLLQSNDDCSTSEIAKAKPKSVPQNMAEKQALIDLPRHLFN